MHARVTNQCNPDPLNILDEGLRGGVSIHVSGGYDNPTPSLRLIFKKGLFAAKTRRLFFRGIGEIATRNRLFFVLFHHRTISSYMSVCNSFSVSV